jgi:hypothetical protein
MVGASGSNQTPKVNPNFILDASGAGLSVRGGLGLTAASAVDGGYQDLSFPAGIYTKSVIRGLSTGTTDASALAFLTAPAGDVPTERMRIISSGNVGIGNTAPGSKLTVAGTVESTTGGFKFPDATTQTTAATGIPSGTSMLFVQTAAPTGWTKSTTHNDKALRVVSGTASNGGSVAFATAFASKSVSGSIGSTTATNQSTTATNQATTATNQSATQGGSVSTSISGSVSGSVGATTLSSSQIPSHSHNIARGGNVVPVPNGDFHNPLAQTGSFSSDSTGGGGSHDHSWSGSFSGSASSSFSGSSHNHSQDSHNHTQNSHNHTQDAHNHTFTGTAIDLAVSYVDVIIATKD